MSLTDNELRQLRDHLVRVFEDSDRRKYFLSLAFPSDLRRRVAVPPEGAAREFTWRLIDHYYHSDRNSLLTILNTVQDEEGGDLARALQPFVEKLTITNARYKIFVSYRRKSGYFMHSVIRDLRAKMPESEFFVDFASIDSADFGESIRRHLTQSNCFLLMLTAETLAPERLSDPNDWIRYEVRLALEHGLPIIQVSDGTLLPRKDQLPEDIQALVEREGRDIPIRFWDAAIQELVNLIYKVIDNPPAPVQTRSLPNRAEPQSSADPEQDLNDAIELYERREYEKALPLLERLEATNYKPASVKQYLKKARRGIQVRKQYEDIATLSKSSNMLKEACREWLKFRAAFTDWQEVLDGDPDRLDQTLDPVRFSLFTNLKVLRSHTNAVWSVAWSHDGKRLASGSKDGTVRLWDTENWREVTLPQFEDWVCAVAWSPRARYLAAGLNNGRVCLWDVSKEQLWQNLDEHEAAVRSVSWSPDGHYLASAAEDGTVQIWHLSKTEKHSLLKLEYKSRVYSVTWSHDGRFLAVGADKKNVQVYKFESRQIVETFEFEIDISENSIGWAYSVSWSPDSAFIAASTHEGVIVWDVGTRDRKHTYNVNVESNCIAWSPNGRYLASGSEEAAVQIWEINATNPVMSVSTQSAGVNNDYVQSVAWSPDEKYLASASGSKSNSLESDEEGAIIIWGIPDTV